MCFSIPYQVVHVNKYFVTIETGAIIKITKKLQIYYILQLNIIIQFMIYIKKNGV